MEWVNLINNAVEKIRKDGRDPDASEFLDLKAFVNSSGEPEHIESISYLGAVWLLAI